VATTIEELRQRVQLLYPLTLLPVGLALNAQLGSSRNRGLDICSVSLAGKEVLKPYVDTNRRFTLPSRDKVRPLTRHDPVANGIDRKLEEISPSDGSQ
jgi:hypothetical protein